MMSTRPARAHVIAVLPAMALALGVASVFLLAAGPVDTNQPGVHLKTISSHVDSTTASLVVETTEPVPYVATQPDPQTLVIDFRNVSPDGVANKVKAGGTSPITLVSVEPSEWAGAPGSRVRVTLAEPMAHHVRSDKNRVVVDFDTSDARPSVLPPASRGGAPADATLAGGLNIGDPIAALNLQALAGQPAAQQAPAGAAAQQAPAPAAPPTPPQPATNNTISGGRNVTLRQYTGTPVSFDFQDADLRAVLRTFHEITGLNIVIDPTVQGTVNTALTDVPWDQALDIILRANKLGYIVDGTIVRIAPLTELANEETARRKLSDEQALSGELRVETKTLSYANAVQVAPLLTKSVLSQRGIVQVDIRTNTLIITDLEARLASADELIANLDKPQRQVEIEARIVQANTNYARALGVQWGFTGRVDPTLGNTTNLAFPNSGSLGGSTGATTGGGPNTAVNLPAPAATSAVQLALGSVNGAFNLDVALSAAETSGKLRILSTPRVSTQNNGEAEITQGTQIPVPTIANNTVTVAFKDAALQLKVTPQITAVGTVIMKITLENSQPDFSRAVNGIPPINTQRAITQVLVNDGETTVIGGIYASQEQVLNDRTPGLSRIPILNWLFKRDTLNDTATELLIFITPRIQKV